MSLPTLAQALQATWPAARCTRVGPWWIRDGAGAGRRASAASPCAPFGPDDIPAAEAAMRALGMAPLFAVRSDQPDLEQALQARGYSDHDHSVFYVGDVQQMIARAAPAGDILAIWPPTRAQESFWVANDIGPARLALMQRATCPKIALVAQDGPSPAGAAYVGADQNYALIHALVVDPEARRRGLGARIVHGAAQWAARQGCDTLALAVTRTNTAARALYASLGMVQVGDYHYRSLPETR